LRRLASNDATYSRDSGVAAPDDRADAALAAVIGIFAHKTFGSFDNWSSRPDVQVVGDAVVLSLERDLLLRRLELDRWQVSGSVALPR
jgi:hypothetical protein